MPRFSFCKHGEYLVHSLPFKNSNQGNFFKNRYADMAIVRYINHILQIVGLMKDFGRVALDN